ncbi:hypothetical protein [Thalassotalea ganghwensis]
MRKLAGYPRYFYILLMLVMLGVMITGMVMTPTSLAFKFEWEVGWRLPGASWAIVAGGHALTGWLLWMLLGALWPIHSRANWRKKQKRFSGSLLIIAIVLLGGSAIGLYYAGQERTQYYNAIAHLISAMIFILLFVYHGFISVLFRQKAK